MSGHNRAYDGSESEAWNEERREKDGPKKGAKAMRAAGWSSKNAPAKNSCGREGFKSQEERLALAFALRPKDAAFRFDSEATRRLVDLKRL